MDWQKLGSVLSCSRRMHEEMNLRLFFSINVPEAMPKKKSNLYLWLAEEEQKLVAQDKLNQEELAVIELVIKKIQLNDDQATS
jgi:hypothetical protein